MVSHGRLAPVVVVRRPPAAQICVNVRWTARDRRTRLRRGVAKRVVQGNGALMSCHGQSPEDQAPRSPVSMEATLIKGTPARYLGHVDAKDEASAIDEAAKEFKVSDT